MSEKRKKVSPFMTVFILVLVLVMIYSGFRAIDSVFNPETEVFNETSSSKTIIRNGIEYFPRQDITVFLLMGIDQYGPVKESESYNNTGEADMVALAVFDEKDESYRVVLLNRDTMMNMPVLGIGGVPAGTTYGQLALSHTYGSGLADSCENTKKAVSDFLGGLTIDYYMAMNMDAISILTDAVDGVKVTVVDDFSAVDPSIPMGETVLNGEQAISFVQTRKDVGNQMNVSRMERHKAYMNGFLEALRGKLEKSNTFVVETYDTMDEYVVSDCSVTTLNSLLTRYSGYTFKEMVSPAGENIKGNTYMEFYVDEDSLDTMILNLFYSEKK